jgi:hypothetical protein
MNIASRNQSSHYQEAKSNLQSLVKQTCQVALGFAVMLLVTGGRPSSFGLSVTVGLGIAFVAWSESKHLSLNTLSMSKESLISPKANPYVGLDYQNDPNARKILNNAISTFPILKNNNLINSFTYDQEMNFSYEENKENKRTIYRIVFSHDEEKKLLDKKKGKNKLKKGIEFQWKQFSTYSNLLDHGVQTKRKDAY